MNVPKNIKRFWMWVGIALLVELAAITLCKRWYWFFPSHEVSEVYTKYADTEGLNVVFFKDFQINDTTFLDVTLIEAKTDSAWEILQTDFNVPIIPNEYKELFANMNTVDCWLAPKGNYQLPMDSVLYNNDAIVVSRDEKKISIFRLTKGLPVDNIFISKIKVLKQ